MAANCRNKRRGEKEGDQNTGFCEKRRAGGSLRPFATRTRLDDGGGERKAGKKLGLVDLLSHAPDAEADADDHDVLRTWTLGPTMTLILWSPVSLLTKPFVETVNARVDSR